jgi:hypothetical protein
MKQGEPPKGGTQQGQTQPQPPKGEIVPGQKKAEPSKGETAPGQKKAEPPKGKADQGEMRPGEPRKGEAGKAEPQPNRANQGGVRQGEPKKGEAGQTSRKPAQVNVQIRPEQRTRIVETVKTLGIRPVAHIGVTIAVGTVVPRTVELRPLPAQIIEIIPEFRRYRFFLAPSEIVIVDPGTLEIVDVIPLG